ncbi:hypothetical protein VPR01S_19_00470 [Vibrio proteolyticus NBRC 13287]|uniref:Uncharacterized protein n=1 Tax=Vibrio proteolyticus NBRC 13287 TaxID=1219065 RepID=U3A4Y8_VIBPR|nr:hypothetical protein VPR01S_19_00470 [Vibrio proteolyticus NBRC 13287]
MFINSRFNDNSGLNRKKYKTFSRLRNQNDTARKIARHNNRSEEKIDVLALHCK